MFKSRYNISYEISTFKNAVIELGNFNFRMYSIFIYLRKVPTNIFYSRVMELIYKGSDCNLISCPYDI